MTEFDDVQLLNKRWGALRLERSTWWTQWAEISSLILPRSGRFFVSDRNKGWSRINSILDSTGTRALRILAAGMMSGMTSPSRPWFKLNTVDDDLMKNQAVKQWLFDVTTRIESVLNRSNAYQVLHGMYEELGAFGTASALIEDDFENIIHLQPFTLGEYAIAIDWKKRVVVHYREFDVTVGNLIKRFGIDAVSPSVRSMFQRGQVDLWVTIRHSIEPREDRMPGMQDAKNMPFRSVYWETGRQDGRVLSESGYRDFPCVCPRWATQGGDIYGNGPGMDALGDVKQLQLQQMRKQQAVDYQINPPLQYPGGSKNRELELFPGGITYTTTGGAGNAITSLFDVELDLRVLLEDMNEVRGRINGAFYSDLFLMISGQPADGRMTATEVAARNEEKLLMLGPVVERLSTELLDPLVEAVFTKLLAANLLPAPPPEMAGHDLNIEYTSIIAQAQKAAGIAGIDRFTAALGQVATVKPDVLDNFDADQWANVYSDKLGVDPGLLVTGQQLAVVRQQRAKAAAQQANNEKLLMAAHMGQMAGNTPVTPDTAAGQIMQKMTGTTGQ